jgi:hypothetical protein
MPYELTISRFGVVAASPILGGAGDYLYGRELVKKFREQATDLAGSDEFKTANAAAFGVAQDWKTNPTQVAVDPALSSGGEPEIVGMPWPEEEANEPEAARQGFETLVGLMPYQKIKLTIADMEWIVRTRASMTGCALQTGARQTKLWWTFEGIPISGEPPKEEQAIAFAALADAMEKAAQPALRTAYEASLARVTSRPVRFDEGPRIRISLADNEDGPVAELLTALRRTTLSTIQSEPSLKPARAGLDELSKFVGEITHKELEVNSQTIEINTKLADARGLICRGENTPSYATLLAGFARAATGTGFGGDRDPLPPLLHEEFVRINSPARQLSAVLANEEARKLDKRLAAH